jgi:hypothetical protein
LEFVFNNKNANNTNNTELFSNSPIIDSPRRLRKTLPSSVDQIEIVPPKKIVKRAPAPAKINYIGTGKKSKNRSFEWSWNKVGWMVCGVLFLRLIFMDAGVIDFYKMENTLKDTAHQLQLVKDENAELATEIHEIRTNARYQRQIVRDHLGVIAKDEYLVIFAKDS